MLLTNPHQLSGGGNMIFCLGRSSPNRKSGLGACVGRGEMPAVAMRPIGVAKGPVHGMAPDMARAREVKRELKPTVTMGAIFAPRETARPSNGAPSAVTVE